MGLPLPLAPLLCGLALSAYCRVPVRSSAGLAPARATPSAAWPVGRAVLQSLSLGQLSVRAPHDSSTLTPSAVSASPSPASSSIPIGALQRDAPQAPVLV